MNENKLPSPEFEPEEPRRSSVRAVSVIIVAALLLVGLGARGLLRRSARGGDMSCVITEPFRDVSIQTVSSDVIFTVGGDSCAVEYRGPSRMACTAEVKNGALVIEEKTTRRWPLVLGLFEDRGNRLTVSLPREAYDALSVETVSGDIEMPDGGVFEDLEMTTVSGDVALSGTEDGDVTVETVSGDVQIRDGSLESLSLNTASGDQTVTSVLADGRMELSTVSGGISLLASDAESLEISSISGDVYTLLLTPKEYVTDTASGDVTIIASRQGPGRCGITTVSGDILCE